MKVLVQLEIEGDDEAAFDVVDHVLDTGVLQEAINDHALDDAGKLCVTSALSRADVIHVGFVVDQATGVWNWSKAFTTEAAARAYADGTAKERCTNKSGEAFTYVGRVESYEVSE
jgi:hypothetical protein